MGQNVQRQTTSVFVQNDFWTSLQCHLAFVCVIGVLLVSGCSPHSIPGFKEETVPISPETLRPYSALVAEDRQMLGFPPLPTNGTVRVLTVDRAGWNREYLPPNYDVSFQFYSGTSSYPHTSRFIALEGTNGEYRLVSEQMTFNGPKRYEADGTMINESISLANEAEQITFIGTNITGTVITYYGPDSRFADRRGTFGSLTPSEIGPVLREWGYDYTEDIARPPKD